MLVPISEASKLSGRSIPTIYRHIEAGKLSATKNRDGNLVIDISELMRVYGDLQSNTQSSHLEKAFKPDAVPDVPQPSRLINEKHRVEIENEFLRKELALYKQLLEDAKEDKIKAEEREKEARENTKVFTRLLEDKTKTPAAVSSSPGSVDTAAIENIIQRKMEAMTTILASQRQEITKLKTQVIQEVEEIKERVEEDERQKECLDNLSEQYSPEFEALLAEIQDMTNDGAMVPMVQPKEKLAEDVKPGTEMEPQARQVSTPQPSVSLKELLGIPSESEDEVKNIGYQRSIADAQPPEIRAEGESEASVSVPTGIGSEAEIVNKVTPAGDDMPILSQPPKKGFWSKLFGGK